MLVDQASLEKNISGDNLNYTALEEIHIFVLANILRRPIIVLAEDIVRSLEGDTFAPKNIAGKFRIDLLLCVFV